MTRVFRHFRRGLDRGDRADDRQIERRADVIECDRARRVAGDDRQARVKALHEPPEQRRDAARDLRFAALAVGKAGAVRGVDDRRVWKQLSRRLQHRQAADAGIEEEDGRVGVHARSVAWSELSRKLRAPFRFATSCAMTREMLFALALGYLFGSIPFGLAADAPRGQRRRSRHRVGQYRRDECVADREQAARGPDADPRLPQGYRRDPPRTTAVRPGKSAPSPRPAR